MDEIGSQWKQVIIYGVGLALLGVVLLSTGIGIWGLYIPQGLLTGLAFMLIGLAIVVVALMSHHPKGNGEKEEGPSV